MPPSVALAVGAAVFAGLVFAGFAVYAVIGLIA